MLSTIRSLIAKARAHRKHRRMLRAWRSTPANQIGTIIAILEANPGVRQQFRRALKVTSEAEVLEALERRRRQGEATRHPKGGARHGDTDTGS
jgi:nicotinamidase-related amidase